MDSGANNETICFGLILHSGNARSYGMEAIAEAKARNLELAKSKIEMGKQELLKAQKTHTDMIQNDASGDKAELSLLLMHSEDHFMMGQLTIDLADELIDVYEQLQRRDASD